MKIAKCELQSNAVLFLGPWHDQESQFVMILGQLQTECGCRFSSSSVSTPSFFRQILSSHGQHWDNKHFTQPTVSSAASFPPNRWSRKNGRASFNFCWNTRKNSRCLYKKLDQVPRLHVNIFLSTPDSAQGPLHHVTFLHRVKDVGIFYPSRDSSPLKSHLFSL